MQKTVSGQSMAQVANSEKEDDQTTDAAAIKQCDCQQPPAECSERTESKSEQQSSNRSAAESSSSEPTSNGPPNPNVSAGDQGS